MTGHLPFSFAPTTIHNNNADASDTDRTYSDSNDFGSMSKNISTPSQSSTTASEFQRMWHLYDTKSNSAAASALASCAPSLLSPCVFSATLVRPMRGSGDSCDLVGPLSTITPQTPLVPSSSVAGKGPPVIARTCRDIIEFIKAQRILFSSINRGEWRFPRTVLISRRFGVEFGQGRIINHRTSGFQGDVHIGLRQGMHATVK